MSPILGVRVPGTFKVHKSSRRSVLKVAADKLKSHFSISHLVLYKYSLLSTWVNGFVQSANGGHRSAHSGQAEFDAPKTSANINYYHFTLQDHD